jgi:hypothetical protein
VPVRPRTEGSTPIKEVNPPKRPRDLMGPGTYREALTNVKIAILKENYPEDKLSEEDQDLILAEIVRVFRMTPRDRLLQFRSYRLERGMLIHVCADQQSGQWLTEAINERRLGKGTVLKATDAKDLQSLSKWPSGLGTNSRKILRSCCNGTKIRIQDYTQSNRVLESLG